jgi:predicted ATP-grasp superfamily ATP-dependent carboligase
MGDMDLIRPLGLAGIPCAAVCRPGAPPQFSRFTTATVPRHDAWRQQEAQVRDLLAFGRAQALPPVLFYGGDPELLIVSRHRDVLSEAFRFVVADATLVDDLLDKARFSDLATRLGLPVPRTQRLRPDDWASAEPPLSLPVIVKPSTRDDAWRPIAGGRKAVRVDTADELAQVRARLAAGGLEALMQEVVPGPETMIESYHAYVDEAGTVVADFTGRKIRTLPPEYGHSTALITTSSPEVATLGRSVLERIGLRGLAKVDFKLTPAGELRLLEVNPRFTLWHHLGAVAGVNLPELVYADLVGLPRPAVGTARPGISWSDPWRDVAAARASGVSVGKWLTCTLRCDAKSQMSLDDPLPFLRGVLWRQVTRRWRPPLAPAAPSAG